jgi:sarcosine oxidase subunit beta
MRVGTPAVEILTDTTGVAGVRTLDEVISTRAIVVAAGIASGDLTRPLDFDLPVRGEARTIFYSGADLGISPTATLVVDFSTSFYFHREGAGLVFAGRDSDLEELSEPATHRLPAIADASIESSWWGYYDMSPDRGAMVGRAPIVGLYYATGFSGHGFMQSPAVGEHLAELVLGKLTSLDLSSMTAERFAHGELRTVFHHLTRSRGSEDHTSRTGRPSRLRSTVTPSPGTFGAAPLPCATARGPVATSGWIHSEKNVAPVRLSGWLLAARWAF